MAKGTPKKKMHEEILRLSAPLFAKTGYDGVSMRDVAVAVGLTPAALYYHFSDKEQLYVDAVGYAFREVTGVLKAAIEAAPNPFEVMDTCRFLPGYKTQNDDPAVLTKHVVRLLRQGL